MKDYADKKWLSEPIPDQRLAQAISYLKERNLWRGSSSCEHVYKNSDGRFVSPGRQFMPDPFK